MAQKVALITGASRGFGRLAAQRLQQAGWRVFGTSRRPGEQGELPFPLLALDVGSDESARNCVAGVLEQAGRIDALVNNAGAVLNGFAEEISPAEARGQMETLFFGAVRMINQVLPLMRRQGGGRIVNVASVAGLIGVPYRVFYSAGKFALEGYSEGLAFELRPFGIHVSLVEPGFFRTELETRAARAQNHLPEYDRIRRHIQHYFENGVRRGGDPEKVARLIQKVLETPRPKLRYPVGKEKGVKWLRTLIPQRLFAWGAAEYFRLK